jgi:hypothetical protein
MLSLTTMSIDENQDIQIGVRVSRTLRGKLEKVQEEHRKLTGIEPTISDVVRMLIERGLEANGKRR